ncbi:MAG: hypothetical protein ACHP7N_01935 [Caulobacterales bacterium]
MHSKSLRASLVAVGALALSATAALADTQPASRANTNSCFFVSQWQGSKASGEHEILIRVNLRDVYRLEVNGDASQLDWPDMHLVSIVRGGDSICSPLDLDLSISDGHGMRVPLIVRSITKLTPEEVAAIPPKFRP